MQYPKKSKAAFQRLNNSFLLRLYYLKKLPALLFFGVGIRSCNIDSSKIFLPFRWSTKNPFKSVYFAAQCAAAELASGVIALGAVSGFDKTSMLVVGFEAEFTKKATSGIIFSCDEGHKILKAIEESHKTGEGQVVKIEVIAKMKDNSEVSRFYITWSFKPKS